MSHFVALRLDEVLGLVAVDGLVEDAEGLVLFDVVILTIGSR